MCIFGTSKPVDPTPTPTVRDAPPVVTGSQTGVDDPKDTKKATEQLKIKREKKEGTFIDPNLSVVEEKLVGSSGSNSLGAKQAKINRQNVAKHNFNRKKYSRSITGRRTGTA